jgi:adenylate kinase
MKKNTQAKLNIVLMGPPGAGKGTQSELLVKKYGICHISTGDMFREAIGNKTPVGLQAKSYIEKGLLVPDDVTIALVRDRLSQPDCAKGYLLDGFPRTIPQAEALEKLTEEIGRPVNAVVCIQAERSVLIARIVSRRVCPNCGASYNLLTKKPLKEGICDNCGAKLEQRKDDTEAAFATRLDAYQKSTEPLIKYYAEKGLLGEVDGLKEIQDVFAEISKFLERR